MPPNSCHAVSLVVSGYGTSWHAKSELLSSSNQQLTCQHVFCGFMRCIVLMSKGCIPQVLYIYIYIERERDRDIHTHIHISLSLSLYIYIYIQRERERYIYIYIHVHTYTYIYTYIHIHIYIYMFVPPWVRSASVCERPLCHSIVHYYYAMRLIWCSVILLQYSIDLYQIIVHCILLYHIITYYNSGKDKAGSSKGGFLNNRWFSWMLCHLYTHTINFITQI